MASEINFDAIVHDITPGAILSSNNSIDQDLEEMSMEEMKKAIRALKMQAELDKQREKQIQEDLKKKKEEDEYKKQYILRQECALSIYRDSQNSTNKILENEIIQKIHTNGEICLYIYSHTGGPDLNNIENHKARDAGLLSRFEHIITNKNVYIVLYLSQNAGSKSGENIYESYVNGTRDRYKISSLYTFTNSLTMRDLSILDNMNKPADYGRAGSPVDMMAFMYSPLHPIKAFQNFQTLIKLIPGSYKNGDWQQCNGFDGIYFNPVTDEVSLYAPASL